MTDNISTQNIRETSWEAIPADEVLAGLSVSRQGLSAQEAQKRLAAFGENKLPEEKKTGFLQRFLAQFNNALIYVLLAATILTAVMQHWIDTWVILGVVLINAIIGYVQEDKAQKALDSIKHLLSLKATVVRDGRRQEIAAERLVPGDIVQLASGSKVPADMRLIETNNFEVEEASLTGESEAVAKSVDPVEPGTPLGDRLSMAFTGTTVRSGTGMGVVVATASDTELGKINTMLTETETMTTPLIRKINQFGRILSGIIVILSVIIFVFAYLFRDYPVNEIILAVIGLAVAAIPEGLPAILTITLAIGVQRMARRKAIIRRLPSVETLGSVTVICSDKTGTLTRNEMTVKAIYTAEGCYDVEGSGYEPEGRILREEAPVDPLDDTLLHRLLQSAFLCNDAEIVQDEEGQWAVVGAPTEGALKVAALKSGYTGGGATRLADKPFDSQAKYRATLNKIDGEHVLFVNGAPDRLLGMCGEQLVPGGSQPLDHDFWEERIAAGASEGQRMLGFACRVYAAGKTDILDDDLKSGLTFIGIAGMIDPPRPDAIEAIKVCHAAGINVKMITGDHVLTASNIGRQMGIGDGQTVISGAELEKMTDADMQEAVKACDVFARTSPEHKLRLVSAIQANGDICAMTGDGVNDAPALKKADIGVAMGIKGTEVTKDAAAMVLADDNFASIASAVEEGRTIYDNLRKTLLFMLPTNGAEALVILIAIMLGMALPITPVQILWVNMVTAVTLGLALSFEAMEYSAMQRPPRDPAEGMLGTYFVFRIVFVSLIIGGLTLMVFLKLTNLGLSVTLAQTIAINTLVAGELFYLFSCRQISSFVFGRGFFKNRVAFISAGLLVLFQIAFTYLPVMNRLFGTQPLTLANWAYPLIGGLAVLVIVETEKLIVRQLRHR